MRAITKAGVAMCVGFLAAVVLLDVSIPARAAASDLTIDVAGDLAKLGGVVTVHTIKVPPEEWAKTVAPNARSSVRVEQRYAEVQLRYPADGSFVYRFRRADATTPDTRQPTFVLSIIGTNETSEGSELKSGFTGAVPSGGRIIRVPPAAEISGEDEATRSMARWGEVVGRDPPPPADSRSARSLEFVAGNDERPHYVCSGAANVQVCTVAAERWPLMEMRWWRSIAEARLERLQHHALRRCYDSRKVESSRNCEPVPGSDEPEYLTPR
jgi:hypothetical protein